MTGRENVNNLGPVKKKTKLNQDVNVFDTFHDVYLKENPSFVDAAKKFKQEIPALGAYEIGSCNAADRDGSCFAKTFVVHASVEEDDREKNGNLDAWHGHLDLIMEGADVIVDTLDGESEIYNDGESTGEVK